MRRYVRIFLLYFENVFQYRGQIFLWFLVSFLHPVIYLLFWRGASQEFSDIAYYYLFFIVAGGLLFVHVEVDAYEDIQQGQLSLFLMKPLSYLTIKFLDELPWRFIQGGFGVVSLLIIWLTMSLPPLSLRFDQVAVATIIMIFGYLVMFIFKMIILLLAFWFIDIGGLQQLSEMLVIIFAGFIMPIRFFPNWVAAIAYSTPFPYTIYFPVTAFQGLVKGSQVMSIIGVQIFWVFLLYCVYSYLWQRGIRKYSAVGQ